MDLVVSMKDGTDKNITKGRTLDTKEYLIVRAGIGIANGVVDGDASR